GKGNLEAMAREERYHFLGALAEERGLPKVATGHTRDDQAETVLMWLLRGSGRRGLGGMSPVRPLRPKRDSGSGGPLIIRPLIDVSREEIFRYLEKSGVRFHMDRTNEETKLLRNWIRLHLLPELKQNIDPVLPERLAHLADVLREEESFLQHYAREELRNIQDGNDLSREAFLQHDKGLRRRLLRLWIEGVVGDLRRFDFHHVEDALRLIAEGPPQGRISLPRGWELLRDYELLRLEKRKPKVKPVCYSYPLAYDSELDIIEAAVRIRTERLPSAPAEWSADSNEAYFDLSLLPRELTVRNFRRGDRFQPLGMKGHKKVKDLFIEKRLSRSVRSRLPLILAADEILWIPGYA
nr:tRNA lysidine(34) synthetase TilS [Armatimonadota bacterium]NIN07013.1 tRNA lysidine(34) synthetase TilS [Armatimonadota bacterium]